MTFDRLSSASQRFQASTRQLLCGLVVAGMFVVTAALPVRDEDDARATGTNTAEAAAMKNRLRLSIAAISSIRENPEKNQRSVNRLLERLTAEVREPSPGETAIVQLPVSANALSAESKAIDGRTAEIVKLIGRTGRRGNRSFCLLAAQSSHLPVCMQFAEILSREGQLSADRVSFRIADSLPSGEIRLEVREVAPPEDPLSEVSL